jgi:uncharacterized SAM-binding protein YcdF (DUF218 family)
MTEDDIRRAEILWEYHRIPDDLVKSDAIIGLGSYDTRVAEHCAELLADDWAPLMIFTGAEGNFTRGKWPKSEAEMFADVAIEAGALPEKILVEPLATNTGDNVRFTRALCEQKAIAITSAIVVAKPNMNRRALATCQLHWPELQVKCSAPDTHFLSSPAPGHTPEDVVSEIVGDLQRMIEYPRLGYQADQEIPAAVRDAYETLVSRGYTAHLF